MRLVTYYTPSHREMCERYVLSQASGFDDIIVGEYPQTCPTGEFKSAGWNDCMSDKLHLLQHLPCDGMPTLYVDSDVCLMPGLAQWAKETSAGLDGVAYSDDVLQWCAGVMLFHDTEQVHRWWRLVEDMSHVLDLPDQETIHVLRVHGKRLPLPMSVLAPDRICNWATVGGTSPWVGEWFDLPETCVAWHANWTIGIDNKLAMLSRVRKPDN